MLGLATHSCQLEARRERLKIQKSPDPHPAQGFMMLCESRKNLWHRGLYSEIWNAF